MLSHDVLCSNRLIPVTVINDGTCSCITYLKHLGHLQCNLCWMWMYIHVTLMTNYTVTCTFEPPFIYKDVCQELFIGTRRNAINAIICMQWLHDTWLSPAVLYIWSVHGGTYYSCTSDSMIQLPHRLWTVVRMSSSNHVLRPTYNKLVQLIHLKWVLTLASKENLETGMFSGPPWTSKCLHPAFAST